MEPATKHDLNALRRMLEEDIQAIVGDITQIKATNRSIMANITTTNRFLQNNIERYDRILTQHDGRISQLEQTS